MQKVYSRINWENDPSTNTPINEDNLNKMDYALDQIDNRVVNLGGYQDRVSQSEKNAKTSETNAKTSETNAKQSEQLAKRYMESAFAGTPEGYEALVEQVGRIDIAKSTDYTIHNTKPGGYRLLEILGNTIQNGTPSLATPFPLLSTGECVDIISGLYQVNKNGVYATNKDYICNKNPIPCKGGDTIGIVSSQNAWRYVLFYNESGFISSVDLGTTNQSATAPSGATYFNFDVAGTLNTVGKITLTINGKYLTCISTNLYVEMEQGTIGNGVITLSNTRVRTKNYIPCKSGDAINITTNEVVEIISISYFDDNDNFVTGEYKSNVNTLSVTIPSGVTKFKYVVGKTTNITPETVGNITLIINGVGETTAYILTNEPPRLGDIFYKENGVWKLEHNVAEAVFDGSNDEGWNVANTSVSGKYRVYTDKGLGFTCANNEIANIMCTSLIPTTADHVFNALGGVSVNINGALVLYDENYNTSNVSLWKAYLQEKQMRIIYPLATPIIEVLDPASQIALNGLETFYGVTHIVFDSRVQPLGIKGEVGTSQVGAYTLKSLLNSESNAIRYEKLNTMILSLGGNV